MAKRKPTKPKRLIRHLQPGDRLVVRGVQGRVSQGLRPDRRHIVEVRRGRGRGKLVGYVNNISRKTGKPTPQTFSRSMIQRLNYSKELPRGEGFNITSGKTTFRAVSNKHFRGQIPKKFISEIREHSGEAFNMRIKFGKAGERGPFGDVRTTANYIESRRMTDKSLKNLIISNFLRRFGQLGFRFSDVKRANSKRPLVMRADISLEFTKVKKLTKRERIRGK